MSEKSKQKMLEAREALERLLETTDSRPRGNHRRRPPKMRLAGVALEWIYREERDRRRQTGDFEPLTCACKLDRIIFTSSKDPISAICGLPGVLAGEPHILPKRPETFRPYGKVIRIAGTQSIKEVQVHYQGMAWLAPFRVTITPLDQVGLQRDDLCLILELLSNPRLILMEVAWDFPINAAVDVAYVERHGLFGRSKPKNVGNHPLYSSWGSRTGSKFVRSYLNTICSYHRVETELHLRDLQKWGIHDIFQFQRLVDILPGHHILFGQIDHRKLHDYLRRSGFSARRREQVHKAVGHRENNLSETLKYLRHEVGISNVRRLIVPVETNQLLVEALRTWAVSWPSASSRLVKSR